MKPTTLKFECEGFDGGVESRRLGERIEISYATMPVMGFDLSDITARDWTIAALLETRLKGKTIAKLCHTSPAQVSAVRKALRKGGYEALIHRGPGRPKKLVDKVVARAIELRRQGLNVREIGDELGISSPLAAKAVRGVARGGGVEQLDLGEMDESELAEPQRPKAQPSPIESEENEAADPQSESSVSTTPIVMVTPDEAINSEPTNRDSEPLSLESEQSEGPLSSTSTPVRELDAMNETSSESTSGQELLPGEPLASGPAEHRSRYAGTLLLCAAAQVLGLFGALDSAHVRRAKKAVYDASLAIIAMLSAWAAGYGSLESMHERNARALGVVLGLERSPSVRTLHRAIAQMAESFNPIKLASALLRGLMAAVGNVPQLFGIDGHFKTYSGKEPIDKGWNTKRRVVERGIADVLVHDSLGRIWQGMQVGAGDSLHEHVVASAHFLDEQLGEDEQVAMAFDRGGFSFDVLNALDEAGYCYVAWLPSTVSVPELSTIAPEDDGAGEVLWEHAKLGTEHRARLLVRRDGSSLVPAVTNFSDDICAEQALEMLSKIRGVQENDIKAARAFAHIDRLVDRGGAKRAIDDRQVDNPEHKELSSKRRKNRTKLNELETSQPISKADHARRDGELLMAELEKKLLARQMADVPSKVPRHQLEPEAQRAWLKTKNRALLQPMKYLLANSRRWLLAALDTSLAPSDESWDSTAKSRTLVALIQAPGTVRLSDTEVVVTLELELPPKPHERLARGLLALDAHDLRFSDGTRRVRFRLAPRSTRDSLPSAPASA